MDGDEETGIERPDCFSGLPIPVMCAAFSPSSVFCHFVIQYPYINGAIMEDLKLRIKEFIQARDWEQYHAPKNLAMALSVEAAEIVEIFQWKNNDEPLSQSEQEHLRQEIGDVLIYLLELADKFEIDIVQAAKDKMVLNGKKYPVEKVKGKSDKYTA
jgi:dCTP diphosphatase